MKGVITMNFKQVFNFKQRIAELIALFKNIKNFDFLGRLKNILSDIPGLAALAGATLMFIGAFLPNIFYGVEIWGIKSYEFDNLFQIGWGVIVFLLTLAILGLAYFKQTFWAGLTSALCLTISLLQAIIIPVSYKLAGGYVSEYVKSGVHVGWFFILFGELAVIGAFALQYFVMKKDETPAVEAEATVVEEAPAAEAVVEAPVVEVAPAAEAVVEAAAEATEADAE